MSTRPIKVAIRYAGGWGVLIFFVVLLSFIFSFLGTLFCAVLAGTMLGSARRQTRWQAIPLSLVFPAVIFTLMHAMKAQLRDGQLLILSAVCFGTYWLAYLATSALVAFERSRPGHAQTPGLPVAAPGTAQGLASERNVPRAGGSSGLVSVAPALSREGGVGGNGSVSSLPPLAAAVQAAPRTGCEQPAQKSSDILSLEALQGQWSCKTNSSEGLAQEKVMVIEKEKLALRITGRRGEVRLSAHGEVRVGPLDNLRILSGGDSASDSLVSI